jgi:hypothetical protein
MDTAAFEDQMVSDWLGLAGYLAEAIAGGDVTAVDAHAELCAELDHVGERRALERAAALAHTQLGSDAKITSLLDGVLASVPAVASVA